MDQETEINQTKAQHFITRWKELTKQQAKVDFETAGLAHEVRQEFPNGAGGDLQCRTWCVTNMEMHGSTAAMFLRAARAFVLFPDSLRWFELGGWQSMGFLLTFNKRDRRRIYKKALEIVEERGRPVSYTTVRNVAFTLGIRQDRVTGRPNRLLVEENLGILRAYVEKLHDDYDLEALPDDVQKAMRPTRLRRLADG